MAKTTVSVETIEHPVFRWVFNPALGRKEYKAVPASMGTDFVCESVVDKTNWSPEAELSVNSPFGGSPRVGLYDFPDGEDTGLDLTGLRNPSLDIVDVDNIRKSLDKKAKADIEAIKAEMSAEELSQLSSNAEPVSQGNNSSVAE